MGLPLSPTLANIFLCFYESTWLADCPDEFRPFLYRRYVDDTFILFKDKSHVPLFLDYLNSKHANINFTMESESSNRLSFLDVSVYKNNNSFQCSVFRKSTFSGITTSFFSSCCHRFKTNSIVTLLHRAFNISSDYFRFDSEVSFLRHLFSMNGFPRFLFDRTLKQFLDKKFLPQAIVRPAKECFYISLPFYGSQSEKLKSDLLTLLNSFYTAIDFKIILTNNFKISSFFQYKDRLPQVHRSSLVYKFSCAQCASEYVGSTVRTLRTRVAEHCGRSFRTLRPLANPPHSAIRDHSESCNQPISNDNFTILASIKNQTDLRLLESMYIFKLKPILNNDQSAFPLSIVNR